MLWTIVIRVVNEEIPSHKQLCLSFMFLFVMIDECTQLLPTLHMKMYGRGVLLSSSSWRLNKFSQLPGHPDGKPGVWIPFCPVTGGWQVRHPSRQPSILLEQASPPSGNPTSQHPIIHHPDEEADLKLYRFKTPRQLVTSCTARAPPETGAGKPGRRLHSRRV